VLVSAAGWNGAALPGRRGMGLGGRPGGEGVRRRPAGAGAKEGEGREGARVTGSSIWRVTGESRVTGDAGRRGESVARVTGDEPRLERERVTGPSRPAALRLGG
jgi:hypothetical protein